MYPHSASCSLGTYSFPQILANFAFLFALMCGRILQRIFFGPLQPREIEVCFRSSPVTYSAYPFSKRLYDQTWMFVTESLLAFTIFRDEFDIPFVLMFGFLLFVKCFHWLMADRVESVRHCLASHSHSVISINVSSDGSSDLSRSSDTLPHSDECSVHNSLGY